MRTLIIADSRGYGLLKQSNVTNWLLLGFYIEIICFAGATIRKGVSDTIKKLGHRRYDIIYVYLGVVNLSLKISARNIVPVFSSRYDMVKSLIREYYEVRNLLSRFTRHVIICELTGLHFGTYNTHSNLLFPLEQRELNSGIILLNEHIRAMNNDHNVCSPHIMELTHKQRKEKNNLVHRYSATTYDGLHFCYSTNANIFDRFILNIFQLHN